MTEFEVIKAPYQSVPAMAYRISVVASVAGVSYSLESMGAMPLGCEDIAAQLVMIAKSLVSS